jgi:hypothetical protein
MAFSPPVTLTLLLSPYFASSTGKPQQLETNQGKESAAHFSCREPACLAGDPLSRDGLKEVRW